MIKVHIDTNLCQSHGECVGIAPDLFQLDDDDFIHWQEEVDDSRRAELESAVDTCPMTAIRIEG